MQKKLLRPIKVVSVLSNSPAPRCGTAFLALLHKFFTTGITQGTGKPVFTRNDSLTETQISGVGLILHCCPRKQFESAISGFNPPILCSRFLHRH